MKKMVKRVISLVSAMIMMICGLVNYRVNTNANAATGSDRQIAELTESIAKRINDARADLGLEPVYVVPYLNSVANIRSGEIVFSYSHTRLDGSDASTAIDRHKIKELAGGNIAAAREMTGNEVIEKGTSNADDIFTAWKRSPGHWAAITDPTATHMGIGIVYDPFSKSRWYWSITFISIPRGIDLFGQKLIISDSVIIPECTGDLNGDSVIDCFDVAVIDRYLNGNDVFNGLQMDAADLCSDGVINKDDETALRKYILGEIENLPVTADELAA